MKYSRKQSYNNHYHYYNISSNILSITILLLIINYVGIVESTIPIPRHSTINILIDSKLYFFGGISKGSNDIEDCINQILLLDLSNSFNNNDIPWIDLTPQTASDNYTSRPLSYCWSSFGVINKIIYLFGNVRKEVAQKTPASPSNSNAFVNAFDTSSKQWKTTVIGGVAPEQRISFQAVNDNQNAKTYIFGGLNDFNGGAKSILLNDMNILNTNSNNSLSWESIILFNKDKPPLWSDYTATLLSNGDIIYIGGRQMIPGSTVISFAPMNEIWVYDTNEAVWKKNISTGINPGIRIGHSAVLDSSENIIIFGGKSLNDGMTPATPNLIILNTSNFRWSEPRVTNQSPPALAYHSATLINNQMMITFGNTTTGPSSDIYILDVSLPSEYKWTPSYNLNINYSNNIDKNNESYLESSTSPSSTTNSSSTSNDVTGTPFILDKKIGRIIGIAIGGTFSITTIVVVTALLYVRWKKLQKIKNTTSPLFAETPSPGASVESNPST